MDSQRDSGVSDVLVDELAHTSSPSDTSSASSGVSSSSLIPPETSSGLGKEEWEKR